MLSVHILHNRRDAYLPQVLGAKSLVAKTNPGDFLHYARKSATKPLRQAKDTSRAGAEGAGKFKVEMNPPPSAIPAPPRGNHLPLAGCSDLLTEFSNAIKAY